MSPDEPLLGSLGVRCFEWFATSTELPPPLAQKRVSRPVETRPPIAPSHRKPLARNSTSPTPGHRGYISIFGGPPQKLTHFTLPGGYPPPGGSFLPPFWGPGGSILGSRGSILGSGGVQNPKKGCHNQGFFEKVARMPQKTRKKGPN